MERNYAHEVVTDAMHNQVPNLVTAQRARDQLERMAEERDTLRQQRDELLAALQRLDNAYAADAGACPNMDMLTAYQTNSQAHAQARTALAACKKSPVSVPG